MNPFRKQTKMWTTKSGERIRICDMTDSHLANTIKLIERLAHDFEASALSACNPFGEDTMACFFFDMEQDRIEEHGVDPSELSPLYDNLIEEQSRREYAKATTSDRI